MEHQPPYGKEDRPKERLPERSQERAEHDYVPPPEGYNSAYGRPTTEELIKRSYPAGKPGFQKFLKTDKLVMAIAFGLFLMFLGAVLIAAVATSEGPQDTYEAYDDDDDGYMDSDQRDDYNRDREDFYGLRNTGVLLGKIIVSFGLLIVLVALFGGGLINNDLDKYVRVAMVIIAGLILMWSGLMVGWSAFI